MGQGPWRGAGGRFFDSAAASVRLTSRIARPYARAPFWKANFCAGEKLGGSTGEEKRRGARDSGRRTYVSRSQRIPHTANGAGSFGHAPFVRASIRAQRAHVAGGRGSDASLARGGRVMVHAQDAPRRLTVRGSADAPHSPPGSHCGRLLRAPCKFYARAVECKWPAGGVCVRVTRRATAG